MLLYRKATIDDIVPLIPLMEDFIKESEYKDLPIDVEAIYDTLYGFVHNDNAIVFLALLQENIIGVIVGTTSILPFNRLRQSSETIWYVKPEFRNTHTGLCLYTEFYQWALDLNSVVIHTASPYGSKLNKIYEKNGYNMFEELYIKVLYNGS